MIIPVSIDGVAAAAAEAAAAAAAAIRGDGKDGLAGTKGVCVPEWSMVELQGELVSKDSMSGKPLGSMTSENGKPMLVISNHKLEGKSASEPKPLLVLRKVLVDANDENSAVASSSSSSSSSSRSSGGGGGVAAGKGGRDGGIAHPVEGNAMGNGAGARPQAQRVEYRIVGRVTRKTIFKTRPKPLIRKLGDGGGHGGGSTARSCM